MEIVCRKELKQIKGSFEFNPIVSILGPRQCGKTTLAKQYLQQIKKDVHYFDLEKHPNRELLKDVYLALDGKRGLVVVDEIQRLPSLFEALRVLVDERKDIQFLILGSAAPDIVRNVSETLAGRRCFDF